MIYQSINHGRYTKAEKDIIFSQEAGFFAGLSVDGQIQKEDLEYKTFIERFPLGLNIIKVDNKIIGHTLVLPSDNKHMSDFLDNKLTEQEMFLSLKDNNFNNEALYLGSALILSEYQNRGIGEHALINHILKYQQVFSKEAPKLFWWSLTERGSSLARKVAKYLGMDYKGKEFV